MLAGRVSDRARLVLSARWPARDHILTATPLNGELKAQVAMDSRSSTDAARSEWPLRGIAEDISEQTQLVNVPTLVIAGENDKVEPVQVLRHNLLPYLSHAQFTVIPRTGHLIPLGGWCSTDVCGAGMADSGAVSRVCGGS